METFKWRILLATANILLTVLMCWVGLRQYESDHRLHPEYFYHGNLYYLPPAQIAVYSLNAPAYSAATAFQDFGIRHFRRGEVLFTAYAFFYVYIGFFPAVAVFWWWIGAHLDMRSRGPMLSEQGAHYPKIALLTLCAMLSFAMAYQGYAFRRGTVISQPIPISQMVWGVGLGAYFCLRVLREVSLSGTGSLTKEER